MMHGEQQQIVEDFVRTSRQRLAISRAIHLIAVFVWSYGAAALTCGLWYGLRGYAVDPLPAFGGTLILAVLVVFGFVIMNHWKANRVVHYLDDFFEFKDGLVTAYEAMDNQASAGFARLQLQKTAAHCDRSTPSHIPITWPIRTFSLAALFIIGSLFCLGFTEDPEITRERDKRAELRKRMEEVKKELQEELKALEDTLSPDETKDLQALKKKIEELKPADELRDALKQLAAVEKQLAMLSDDDQLTVDENYLQNMGMTLAKKKRTRKMGMHLKNKKYGHVRQQLKKMTQNKKNGDRLNDLKTLNDEMRKHAKNSRSNSKFRSNALKKHRNLKLSDKLRKWLDKLAENADEADGENDDHKNENDQEDMEELTQEDIDEMEEALERYQDGSQEFDQGLRKFMKKKGMRGKLKGLRRRLGGCQNYLSRNGGGRGGNKAGRGVDRTRREGQKEDYSNTKTTRLKGQKGKGPSRVQVEAAATGGGVSRLQDREVSRNFKRQIEAYIQRDDVPEERKLGVKEYFDSLNNIGEDRKSEEK